MLPEGQVAQGPWGKAEVDRLWWVGVHSPRPMVGVLVSWELPCDHSPRRKLWGCAISSGSGSHRRAETGGMRQEGGSYPPHHGCSWQIWRDRPSKSGAPGTKTIPAVTLKMPPRHMFWWCHLENLPRLLQKRTRVQVSHLTETPLAARGFALSPSAKKSPKIR